MLAALDLSFLSGWALTAGVGVLAWCWWFAGLDAPALSRHMRVHLNVSVALVALCALHVEPHVPTGWIETILLVLFLGLLSSTVVGLRLVRGSGTAIESIHRWLQVHVALTYGLLGAALFHGVFVHGHGMLAYTFLGG